jgi:PPK2 family polyphosphate:nucleotide phosphotransferase
VHRHRNRATLSTNPSLNRSLEIEEFSSDRPINNTSRIATGKTMAAKHRFNHRNFRVVEGEKLKLKKIATTPGKELNKKDDAQAALAEDIATLKAAQEKLFAAGQHSILIIMQGMDASGKDGAVSHVMSGVNPQGCRVYSFKAPSAEELQHHFLWRPMRFLPERGMISIFNRSYYEEVLFVRVHPEFLTPQKLPKYKNLEDLWEQRYQEINNFEATLTRHGTSVLKFFLHVSKEEQKNRLLERFKDPAKHWKVNERDLQERALWKDYQEAFEDMMVATSSKNAPWYMIPADDKWYARAAIADIVAAHLESLNLEYPTVTDEQRKKYAELAIELEKQA